MVAIKLVNGKDIRRISLEEPLTSFASLVVLAKQTFGESYPKEEDFLFKYKDNENDLISITNDKDLEEAFLYYSNLNAGILKIELTSTSSCCFQKFFKDEDCPRKIKEFFQQKKKEFCERRKRCASNNDGKRKCGRILKKVLFALFILFVAHKCCFLSFFLLFAGLGFCFAKRICRSACFIGSNPMNCARKQNENVVNRNVESKEEVDSNDNNNIRQPSRNLNEKGLPFQTKLKQLEDMGFTSRTNNIEALINNNGDVLETVKELLEKKN